MNLIPILLQGGRKLYTQRFLVTHWLKKALFFHFFLAFQFKNINIFRSNYFFCQNAAAAISLGFCGYMPAFMIKKKFKGRLREGICFTFLH